MKSYFKMKYHQGQLKIRKRTAIPFFAHTVYLDRQHLGTYKAIEHVHLDINELRPGKHVLYIFAYPFGNSMPVYEHFVFSIPHAKELQSRDFQPGDILVACDNAGQLPPGFMGHAAIVVDSKSIIESPGPNPPIEKSSVLEFLIFHPLHAQFRPQKAKMGKKAAAYAQNFFKTFVENVNTGVPTPVFSLSLSHSLDDPWRSIYCSKFVWLCYYYGANYEFQRGYFWFAPEDLYEVLEEDPNFKQIYRHDNFHFYIDL